MFDHLLESSHRDDSNKWSNIRFGQEITELASIEVNFTHLIWCSGVKVLVIDAGLLPSTICGWISRNWTVFFSTKVRSTATAIA